MSIGGTSGYTDLTALPELVAQAVRLGAELGFDKSCRPEQGRLLHALAAGAAQSIGETGTGCGVGLAWLVSARRPGVRVVSVERDARLVEHVRRLFDGVPDVAIVHGDWTDVYAHGPFDLLVLDGGGNAKGGGAADPARLVRPGGVLVVDDFTPATEWPPTHAGQPDEARLHWLSHPELAAIEVRLAPDLASVVATRRLSRPAETA
ncbi:putative O-methyltransferase YrrM [Hamadaea flava]|uniref:O-methyltransferase n=1 Tax=Hamadaea flava TaxID=1742688 RepID=A0ABV8LXR5_9ACTN|nr:class I SAM-dependent methyltransferase [Hamadaea flava]MCP2321691.1 putative O-methyltransferase YrrM [Hamadaea flava]